MREKKGTARWSPSYPRTVMTCWEGCNLVLLRSFFMLVIPPHCPAFSSSHLLANPFHHSLANAARPCAHARTYATPTSAATREACGMAFGSSRHCWIKNSPGDMAGEKRSSGFTGQSEKWSCCTASGAPSPRAKVENRGARQLEGQVALLPRSKWWRARTDDMSWVLSRR